MGNNKSKVNKNVKNKKDDNIIKMKTSFNSKNMIQSKKLAITSIIIFLIFLLLIFRIGYLQFVQGSTLKEAAYKQQAINQIISPKRGNIYDSTGKQLAISAQVDTITINPEKISKKNDEEGTKELKEKVAKGLSEIFELDYNETLEKVNSSAQVETIAKKVEQDKVDKLEQWMEENEISVGINIDEDTKRYYPYDNVASNVIGFCGSDNQGLSGIEYQWDSVLTGTPGKIVSSKGSDQQEIPDSEEKYISAENGSDITLTIDVYIQTIVEKYLKQAVEENNCEKGGNAIVMNPKTGDILAMASYPDYNLNEPYETTIEELKANWDNLSETEQVQEMQKVWRNKAVADTYEPGSTFKLVTASAALEEGITTTDKEGEFCCTGGITVAGVRISCWRYYNPHGSESLREALKNSCNPVFIGLGQEIGVSKYYDYIEKFGLLRKTGIDLPGEAGSIFLKEDKVGPVELATISFGQRFEITPIQMITAVSTIANKGVYIKPRIVKQIIDSTTGEVKEIPVEEGERVISKETAEDVLSMMGTVVAEGTGKNAQVQGYSIGGKTGTSEDGVNTGKYVTSFVGVAPISDPEVVVLITLYNPTGEGGHQGGGVAAPIGSQVLGEVLPYLEVQKDNVSEEDVRKEIETPNVVGMTIKEAKKELEKLNLGISYEETEEDISEKTITSQVPNGGVKIYEGTNVRITY